jgi:hypothetical protein
LSSHDILDLVKRSGFIFRGSPVATGVRETGDSALTATIEVTDVLRSTEALRGLSGSLVILVGEEPEAREPDLVLFTNLVSVGQQVVAREVGHRAASEESLREIAAALEIVAEQPLVDRVADAELIVVGEVTETEPLTDPMSRRSEHDPDWWLARIALESVIKGPRKRGPIRVLFAHSSDIVWRRAPKLHEGQIGIFLLVRSSETEVGSRVPATVYQATDRLDFLPIECRSDVERANERQRREG